MKFISESEDEEGIGSFTLDTSQQRSRVAVSTLHVASGLDNHHDLVMTLTMLICVIGTFQMIREL